MNTSHSSSYLAHNEDEHSYASDNSFDNEMSLENPLNTINYRLFKKSSNLHRGKEKVSADRKVMFERYAELEQEFTPVKKAKKKPKTKSSKVVKQSAADISAAAARYSAPTASSSGALLAEEVQFPRERLFDTTELEVEADAKVRALGLRIAGQRSTIRSLETQLAESAELLAARNKQLAQAHARLKAVDQQPRLAAAASKTRSDSASESKLRATEDAAERYKVCRAVE